MIKQLAMTALAATVVASCGPNPKALELRLWSDNYAFRVTSDPTPPLALEPITYRIVVQDKKTGQPIETGEGRIFANTLEGARTYDGFEKGAGVGTYKAKLRFVAAGQWAIGIQFHSDSTKPLEKTEWMQDVLQERPGTP